MNNDIVPQGPLIPGTLAAHDLYVNFAKVSTILETNDIISTIIETDTITVGTSITINETISGLIDPVLTNDISNKNYLLNKISPAGGPLNSIQVSSSGFFSGSNDLMFINDTVVSNILFTSSIVTEGLQISEMNLLSISIPNTLTFPAYNGQFNQILVSSNNELVWTSRTSPAGIGSQVQFNDGINFAASEFLTYNDVNDTLYVQNLHTGTIIADYSSTENLVIGSVSLNSEGNYTLQMPNEVLTNGILTIDQEGQLYWSKNESVSLPEGSVIINQNQSIASAGLIYSGSQLSIGSNIEQGPKSSVPSIIDEVAIADCLSITNSISNIILCTTDELHILDGLTIINSVLISGIQTAKVFNNTICVLTIDSLLTLNFNLDILSELALPGQGADLVITDKIYITGTSFVCIVKDNIITKSIGSIGGTSIQVFNDIIYVSTFNNIFSLYALNQSLETILTKELQSVNDFVIVGHYIYCIGTYFIVLDILNSYSIVKSLEISGSSIYVLNGFIYIIDDTSLFIIDDQSPIAIDSYTETVIGTDLTDILIFGSDCYICSDTKLMKINIHGTSFTNVELGIVRSNEVLVNNCTINRRIDTNNLICRDICVHNFSNSTKKTVSISTALSSQEIEDTDVTENSIIKYSYMYGNVGQGIPIVIVKEVLLNKFTVSIFNKSVQALTGNITFVYEVL